MSGFIIAAPSSGAGKTLVTLGLLRAFQKLGIAVRAGKAGPDYIDPQFHQAALQQSNRQNFTKDSPSSCLNFDPWAMQLPRLQQQATDAQKDDHIFVLEAMMGLFDGASDGSGSAADLASLLELPVILVVNCSKMSHSIAAIVQGFKQFRHNVNVAGVILNHVGSPRHAEMLRSALRDVDVSIIGHIFRDEKLQLSERHLGLVQASENADINHFIEHAADTCIAQFDFNLLQNIASVAGTKTHEIKPYHIEPIGQKIAVAYDLAFGFCYPHLLNDWRSQGAEISFFSPLNDEAPHLDCDAVYLPGGYPELHAGMLSQADRFRTGMINVASSDKRIYGECGGYMVMGEGLIDGNGMQHKMLGLLPLVTNFQKRKLNLGYRRLLPTKDSFWNYPVLAHEFHYSTIEKIDACDPLFESYDAMGDHIGSVGQRRGHISGSYMHVIDREAAL